MSKFRKSWISTAIRPISEWGRTAFLIAAGTVFGLGLGMALATSDLVPFLGAFGGALVTVSGSAYVAHVQYSLNRRPLIEATLVELGLILKDLDAFEFMSKIYENINEPYSLDESKETIENIIIKIEMLIKNRCETLGVSALTINEASNVLAAQLITAKKTSDIKVLYAEKYLYAAKEAILKDL